MSSLMKASKTFNSVCDQNDLREGAKNLAVKEDTNNLLELVASYCQES